MKSIDGDGIGIGLFSGKIERSSFRDNAIRAIQTPYPPNSGTWKPQIWALSGPVRPVYGLSKLPELILWTHFWTFVYICGHTLVVASRAARAIFFVLSQSDRVGYQKTAIPAAFARGPPAHGLTRRSLSNLCYPAPGPSCAIKKSLSQSCVGYLFRAILCLVRSPVETGGLVAATRCETCRELVKR